MVNIMLHSKKDYRDLYDDFFLGTIELKMFAARTCRNHVSNCKIVFVFSFS